MKSKICFFSSDTLIDIFYKQKKKTIVNAYFGNIILLNKEDKKDKFFRKAM